MGKTLLVILMMNSAGSSSVDTVEFDSLDVCEVFASNFKKKFGVVESPASIGKSLHIAKLECMYVPTVEEAAELRALIDSK